MYLTTQRNYVLLHGRLDSNTFPVALLLIQQSILLTQSRQLKYLGALHSLIAISLVPVLLSLLSLLQYFVLSYLVYVFGFLMKLVLLFIFPLPFPNFSTVVTFCTTRWWAEHWRWWERWWICEQKYRYNSLVHVACLKPRLRDRHCAWWCSSSLATLFLGLLYDCHWYTLVYLGLWQEKWADGMSSSLTNFQCIVHLGAFSKPSMHVWIAVKLKRSARVHRSRNKRDGFAGRS